MHSLDKDLNLITKKITQEDRLAFNSCFIAGLICHLFVYVGHYPAYSGLNVFINNPMAHIREGRVASMLLTQLDGNATIPLIIGILSLVLYSLTCVFNVRILEIKSKTAIILTSSIFVSFPVIAAMNYFLHMADCLAAGALFASLGVWFWKKGNSRKNNLWSIFCFVVCMFFYQAELSCSMVLIFLSLVLGILDGADIKKLLQAAFRAAFLLVLALATYYICFKTYAKLLFVLFGTVCSRDFSLNLASIIDGIFQCYHAVNWFWNSGSFLSLPFGRAVVCFSVLDILLFAAVVLASVCFFSEENHEKKDFAVRIISAIMLILLFPVIANITFVISPLEPRTTRQFLAHVYIFLLPLILIDRYGARLETSAHALLRKFAKIQTHLAVFMGLATFAFFAIITNTAYMNSYLQYERDYSLAVRMVERIESTEGYYPGLPVAIVMENEYATYYGNTDNILKKYIPGMEQQNYGIMSTDYGIQNFIQQFIHTHIDFVEHEPPEDILNILEPWPSKNCTLIDGGGLYIRIT